MRSSCRYPRLTFGRKSRLFSVILSDVQMLRYLLQEAEILAQELLKSTVPGSPAPTGCSVPSYGLSKRLTDFGRQ